MTTYAGYLPALRRLHWLVAILILLGYLAVEQREMFERGSVARFAMMQAHFWFGLSIFVLAAWRIMLRLRHTSPPITPPPPAWQVVASRLMHVTLYAFLIGMPLLGLATAWTDAKTVYLPFTDTALPALLSADKGLAHTLEELHESASEVFYWVIGLHVLAALYHHAIRRDDTLLRMLPRRNVSPPTSD